MNNFIRFIKDRRALLAYYAITMMVVLLVPLAAGASMQLAGYLACLMSAACAVLLAIDFFYFRRRLFLLRSLETRLTALRQALPEPADATEMELFPLIASLCADCAKAREQLAQAQQERMHYYTLWVHQIKTPIAAMRLVMDRVAQPEADVLRQELFRVEQYADLALRYVKLGDIASDLVIADCSVREVVRESVKKYALPLVYQHLSVALPENDLIITTDRRWLSFILEQILSNAVKYTKEGGVTITLAGSRLTVTDTGIGIRAEDLPRIFEKGYTGYNGRLDARASGIGLYMAKKAADALGIQLLVASAPGAGTSVTLLLPERDAMLFLPF